MPRRAVCDCDRAYESRDGRLTWKIYTVFEPLVYLQEYYADIGRETGAVSFPEGASAMCPPGTMLTLARATL